ncbi:PREDICTED: uncharacterized protein LOC109128349 [Camelina sativa]|uniref:Uncharacterized protein LOC109128349 n=1 Tax=Camelina sativa TaxID=90675 RepID=A0ABM1QTK2_CAMSA|nr:PREDICTED: uncharacterized protein LOC109128349 [Camelina sativa]
MNVHDAFLHGDLEEEVYMTIPSGFWASGLNKGVMWLYVLIYVDDLLIGGKISGAIYRFKEYLSECVKMKDLSHLKYLLGIEVAYSSQGIDLSQRKYTLDIVDECALLVSWPFDTPMEQNHKLQIDGDGPYADPGQYRRIFKRLIYLTVTRPDLSYVIHILAQFLKKPQVKHWEAALRVVRYPKGCPGQGLWLSANRDQTLSAYCNSDYQSCPITR